MKILTREKQDEIYYLLAQVRCATFGIKVNTVSEAEIISRINKEINKRTEEIARIIGGIDGEVKAIKLGMRIIEKGLGSRYKTVEDDEQ